MKLTLLHKGLILVSIPLCFEVLVFTYLINAQDHLELEAQKINRNKKINDQVNLIVQDMVSILESVRRKTPGTGGSPSLIPSLIPKQVVTDIADLKLRFNELEVLAADEPDLLQKIRQGKAEVSLAIKTLVGLEKKLFSGHASELSKILHDTSLDVEVHLQNLIDLGLFDWATKKQVEEELLRKEIWERIRFVLKCAVGLSILLGIAGAFLMSGQIVRRVSRLRENATLMGQSKPLLPLQNGTDELAELDSNFHQTADLLQAAERTKQEVTATITNDLRTPLQKVRGFVETLKRGMYGELNASGERLSSVVVGACDHMSRLIDNVLQLEKLRSGAIKLNTSQFEVGAFLDKCLESTRLLAEEKNISINTIFKNETIKVLDADSFWLEQVVTNVLSNAVKFSPSGSIIMVTVLDAANALVMRIADQGPGIPADQQKLIFNRFHRVKSTTSTPGTGLGLAIAKELVELHGGSIAVESAAGKGATFVLTLPLSSSGAPSQSAGKDTGAASPVAPSEKKPGLKLLYKGLILISIPLCLELALFGMLLNLQTQVEQEANRIDHNRQVNDAANNVLRDLMYAAFALRERQRTHERTQASDDHLRALYADVQDNFQKLEKLVDNQDMATHLKHGERGVKLLAEQLLSPQKSMTVKDEIDSELIAMMDYLAKRSATTEYDLHGSELRAQSRMFLKVALVLSIITSFVAAWFFSKHIVVRLNKLGKNAKLLTEGEPLLAPVQGSDEISELDETFHAAAQQIDAANRMRQEATAMITHDLRAPLQSLRSFFEMLEHGKFGAIDAGGRGELTASEDATRDMEGLIDRVLQAEKQRSA